MSYFTFNNISSESLGVHIQSKNVYSAPKFDVTLTAIPGRNGDLINPNGRFANVNISYTCFVAAKSIAELSSKITAIKNWLYTEPDKYHALTDSFDSGFKRYAVFNSKLDISDEINKIGVFTVSFSCKPYRYLLSGETRETHTTSFSLINPYQFIAKPYLKIYGTGTGQLVFQNSGVNKVWNFTSLDGYIECDSELMNFYKGTVLKNNLVSGPSFPELGVGNTTISFSGGITKVDIIPRWVSI